MLWGEPVVSGKDIGTVGAWDRGAVLVARHLWCELGLEMTLDTLHSSIVRRGMVQRSRAGLGSGW